jgi:hypothetical protein
VVRDGMLKYFSNCLSQVFTLLFLHVSL